MNCYSIWLLIMVVILPAAEFQQQFVSVDESAIRIVRERDGWIAGIPFQIHEPYHIQAVSGAQENVIPTTITFDNNEHLEIVQYEFTALQHDTVYLDSVPSKVLSGTFEVNVFFKVRGGNSAKVPPLNGILAYQACNDRQCFFPRTLAFQASIKE